MNRLHVAETHKRVFDFLLTVNRERNVNAVLRVAGGWVRDSLLGIPSHDIDIAIESQGTQVTGSSFANEIASFQREHNLASRTVSVIKTNPEKSKHIETAQITLFDIPVEFCHLRHDSYATDSRVPSVRLGTPREDAERRDFTVNALFYNLHTESVEDFTSLGLIDLESRLLRCPLSPHATFMDDPLRLLRGIRFAGQLGFSLHASIYESVTEELLQNLTVKVSRERLGIEWSKMLKGPQPALCLRELVKLNLLPVVMTEAILRKGKGAEVESLVSMMPHEEGDIAEFVQYSHFLSEHVFPTIGAFSKKGDDRLIWNMFVLVYPLIKRFDATLRFEKINGWSTHGLKQPVAVSTAVRKLCDAAVALERLEVCELLDQMTGEPLRISQVDIVFDSLLFLADRSVPPNSFIVVLLVMLTERRIFPLEPALNHIMSLISASQGGTLLESASCALPIRGDELHGAIGIQPKFIGTALLTARRYLLHNPTVGKDEIIAHLQKSSFE